VVLSLSESEAYNRVVAARAVRKFPLVLERLADGSINLTTVRILYKHLTPENHRELIDASLGRSKRDVERLIAKHFPQPAVPSSVRKLPAPVIRVAEVAPALSFAPAVQAQDLLRHSLPDGDVAQIFDRALTLLLQDLARRKFAATNRPRKDQATNTDARHPPNAIKRAVWLRDCGRCKYLSPGGRRCSERGLLEFHHRHRYADGGKATLENIELRCRAHNVYEEKLQYALTKGRANEVREAIPGWDMSARLSSPSIRWPRPLQTSTLLLRMEGGGSPNDQTHDT
jgi:hypothetical protein